MDINLKIRNYLDILRTHYNFNIGFNIYNDYFIFETPFKQQWDFDINILYSSIKGQEGFYLNIPALILKGENDNFTKFMEEINAVTKIVKDLNDLINEWRKLNE